MTSPGDPLSSGIAPNGGAANGDTAGPPVGPELLARRARTPDETAALGAALAAIARPGDLFCLQGGLGSGKTVLARGFIRALAGPGTEVPSPTFNIVLTYPTAAATVWHFDLYRVGGPDELWELGLDEAFGGGISLVEWPERLGGDIPAEALWLDLAAIADAEQGPETGEAAEAGPRSIVLRGGPGWAARLHEAGLD